jgi:hypothetical protein
VTCSWDQQGVLFEEREQRKQRGKVGRQTDRQKNKVNMKIQCADFGRHDNRKASRDQKTRPGKNLYLL